MTEGIYKKGIDPVEWVTLGCGLSRSAAKEAIASLAGMGLVEKQRRSNSVEGHLETRYAIKWEALHSLSEK